MSGHEKHTQQLLFFSGVCYRGQIEYESSPDPGPEREVGNRVPEVMQNE